MNENNNINEINEDPCRLPDMSSEAGKRQKKAPAKDKKDMTPEELETAKKSEIFDWIQCVVTALVACVLVFSFVCRTVGVVGPSMESTLHEGDRLVISNLFYEPEQGDIIVLQKDSFKAEPIVKRVIATEGQTVEIDFENCVVYVDGVPLDEPYTKEYGFYTYYDRQDFGRKVTVPENCVFVLGDNRNHSTDSRTDSIGCVDERHILGKVIFRLLPISSFGSVY